MNTALPLSNVTLLLAWLAIAALAFAAVVGAWLLVHPGSLLRADRSTGRWISTRRALRFLEVPHRWERFFYRHHRVFGAIIFLGSAYCLWAYVFRYDPARMEHVIAGSPAAEAMGWLLPAVEVIYVVLTVLTLVAGAIFYLRPSLLKGFEAAANTWVSTRRLGRGLEHESHAVQRLAGGMPRLVGLLVLGLSLYSIVVLAAAISG
ncbi:MAG TPA: hypothetical protein VFA86_08775 [Gammaproteobacteria bacterium]|nr:hypothetical protein [Gammaproteobacteria bacterium]